MLSDLAPWAGAVIALGTLVYTIINGKSKARSDKVAKLEARIDRMADAATLTEIDDRVDKLEDRATKVEQTLLHLPDKNITHRLELSIKDLRSEVQVLSERMKPVSAIAGRLQEAILEKAGS